VAVQVKLSAREGRSWGFMLPLSPMLLTPSQTLPLHSYAFEFKWDGFRALVGLDRGRLSIHSRNLRDMTADFPELQPLADSARRQRLLLDGELVCLGDDGRPSFDRIQQKLRHGFRAKHAVVFMIFDILEHNRRSMIPLSYLERRRHLDGFDLNGSHWRTPAYELDGTVAQRVSRKHALEGIVAKQLVSSYRPGQRGREWLKIKNFQERAFLICGWRAADARRKRGESLLIGHRDGDGEMQYAGAVEFGFSRDTLQQIKRALKDHVTQTAPSGAPFRLPGATFCAPLVPALIRFLEFSGGTVRHASFRSLLG